MSPSSRRAWIEIFFQQDLRYVTWEVALLAEGVDRNEVYRQNQMQRLAVALLAEGVDRNCNAVGP